MGGRQDATDRDSVRVLVGEDKRYRLLELISRGELGTLWEAEDTSLKCAVTVRLLAAAFTADPERVDEFHARMSAVYGRLDHPTIAYVYNYSEEDGSDLYVVMEPLSGEILARRLERAGALDPVAAFRIAGEMAEGLQAAHDLGAGHGGLTAESVMLTSEGSVKLLDFGAASLLEQPSERRAAEERGSGRVATDRSEEPPGDVYRLGMILRQMLAGRGPSTGASVGSKDAKARRSRSRRKGEPVAGLQGREWEAALDPDPAARPSAGLVASMLQQEVAEELRRRGDVATEEAVAAYEPAADEVAKLRETARLEAEGALRAEPDAQTEVNVETTEGTRERPKARAPQKREGSKVRAAERNRAPEESRREDVTAVSEEARDAEMVRKAAGRALRQKEDRLKAEARTALAQARKAEAAWVKASGARQKESARLREEETRRRDGASDATEGARKAEEALRKNRQALRRQRARLREVARVGSERAETVGRELEQGQEAPRAEVARLTADEARNREEARAATERARSAIKQAEQADQRLRESQEALRRAEAQLEIEVQKVAAESRKIEEARGRAEEAGRRKAAELEAEETRLTDDVKRLASEAKAAEEARLAAERARIEGEAQLQAEEAKLQADAKRASDRARAAAKEAQKAEAARRDAQAADRGKGRHRRNWSLRKRDAPTPDAPSASPDSP